MANNNRCVCCGEIIPEGLMVCPKCLAVTNKRKRCKMRHENGNCLPCGGFCTSVNDEICTALHQAYDRGRTDGLRSVRNAKGGGYKFPCPRCGHIHKEPFYTCEKCGW